MINLRGVYLFVERPDYFSKISGYVADLFLKYPGYFVGRDPRNIRDILEDRSRLSLENGPGPRS